MIDQTTTAPPDKNIICVECGKEFVLTGGELLWLSNHIQEMKMPKRCPPCRLKKKERLKSLGIDK